MTLQQFLEQVAETLVCLFLRDFFLSINVLGLKVVDSDMKFVTLWNTGKRLGLDLISLMVHAYPSLCGRMLS